MQRELIQTLLHWKNQATRKPVLLDGARQTGKTYLLNQLLAKHFPNSIYIDFLERPEFRLAFDETLTAEAVLNNIRLLTSRPFNPTTDLLILDEIGECPKAMTSLKYFAQQMPEAFIAASGSNIGLLDSFPVGKVQQLHLRPLSFHEFLCASGQKALIDAFESRTNTPVATEKLLDQLSDYYFVGGMPEAVSTWFANESGDLLQRVDTVKSIQRDLLLGYERDFGKYAGKVNAQLIQAVFAQIPAQLSVVQDDSTRRFKFKDIYPKKNRYGDFECAIDWLHRSHLILMTYIIEGQPRSPLAAYKKDNRIKLFLFDVGLLSHLLEIGYAQMKQQAFDYKGFIAENFVLQELTALGREPAYAWTDARAEVEFLLTDDFGEIVPLEVKSGARTRARSLNSYIQKCQPARSLKLAGVQRSSDTSGINLTWPLYDVCFIPDFLKQSAAATNSAPPPKCI